MIKGDPRLRVSRIQSDYAEKPMIECFQHSARQVTNELNDDNVFYPLQIKIDNPEVSSHLRNCIMQLVTQFLPLIKQFADSQRCLNEFWSVIGFSA